MNYKNLRIRRINLFKPSNVIYLIFLLICCYAIPNESIRYNFLNGILSTILLFLIKKDIKGKKDLNLYSIGYILYLVGFTVLLCVLSMLISNK